MPNSLEQYNQKYQEWQDRHDVEKAFKEWDDGILSFGWSEGFMYTEMQLKAFATFFAERVKGAPLASKPLSQARLCNQCHRQYYPHLSEAVRSEFFCCAGCENGY